MIKPVSKFKRVQVLTATVVGFTLLIVGAFLISLYILDGIIKPWGEADQSMMFWALPVLFIGIASCFIGALLVSIVRKGG